MCGAADDPRISRALISPGAVLLCLDTRFVTLLLNSNLSLALVRIRRALTSVDGGAGRQVRESGLGGMLTRKWTERYFFLIISSCDAGYLEVEKAKIGTGKTRRVRWERQPRVILGAGYSGRISPLSHLCMGKIRVHGEGDWTGD